MNFEAEEGWFLGKRTRAAFIMALRGLNG